MDGTLSGVVSLHVTGDNLEGDNFVPKNLLGVVSTFVVEDVEIGGMPVFFQGGKFSRLLLLFPFSYL